MDKTKKTEKENTIEFDVEIENSAESVKKKNAASKVEEKYVASDAEDQIAALKQQLADMQALLSKMTANVPVRHTENKRDEVVIVCTTTGSINTPFNTWTLSLSRLGQKAILTREQFNELVNNHRKYFERQYIAIDPKSIEVAEEMGLDVYDAESQSNIKPGDIKNFGKMSTREIEDYYKELSEPMQRTFVNYFLNRCYEMDPDFYIVEKMQLINSLTKGHLFDYLIQACLSSLQSNNG